MANGSANRKWSVGLVVEDLGLDAAGLVSILFYRARGTI